MQKPNETKPKKNNKSDLFFCFLAFQTVEVLLCYYFKNRIVHEARENVSFKTTTTTMKS